MTINERRTFELKLRQEIQRLNLKAKAPKIDPTTARIAELRAEIARL